MRVLALALTLAALEVCAGAREDAPLALWSFQRRYLAGELLRDRRGRFDLHLGGPLRFHGAGALQALVLDGAHNTLVVDAALDPARLPRESLTIEAWVRIDTPAAWGGILSAVEDNGAEEYGWVLGYRNDRFFFALASAKSKRLTYLMSSRPYRLETWHHLAATYDGAEMRLLLDGALVGSSREQGGAIRYAAHQRFVLGAFADRNERHPLTGMLLEVRLYDRACSAREIERRHSRLARRLHRGQTPAAAQSGWPAQEHDNRRSATTAEELALPLSALWTHRCAHPPASAWPAPARASLWQRLETLEPRVVYDRAYHLVATGQALFFGSSADDQITCLDAASGTRRWTFFTAGPVRFAPALAGERLYAGSDDGNLYCLESRTGHLVWKRTIAPRRRLVVGSGRLISTWPLRTGPVVAGGVVYATAGLFPSQGVWAAALDARSGKEIWKVALEDLSPQGYLLASPTRLYVPAGRGRPFALGREFGRVLGRFGGPGGAWALLAGPTLVSGPGDSAELGMSRALGNDQIASFHGRRMIATAGISFLQTAAELSALDRGRYLELNARAGALRARQADLERRRAELPAGEEGEEASASPALQEIEVALEALAGEREKLRADLRACVLWRTPCPQADALILAGTTLIAGGEDQVAAYASADGKALWKAPVQGRALSLAVCSGRLLVSTDRGVIHAFGAPAARVSAAPAHRPPDPEPIPARVPLEGIIAKLDSPRGQAVVLGDPSGALARALAAHSELRITCVLRQRDQAELLRRALAREGLYGARIAVLCGAPADLALPEHFANLVLLARSSPVLRALARRILRPWGGVLAARRAKGASAPPWKTSRAGPLAGAAEWTHAYADAGNSACSGDLLVGGALRLQWFGGIGPREMVDRHLRTAPPLARAGRLFVPARDRILCVDAFNGTLLWRARVPGLSRTGFPYDGGYMVAAAEALYLAAGTSCSELDPRSGALRRRIPVPLLDGAGRRLSWGWLAGAGGLLLGSAQQPGAARRGFTREDVEEQYHDGQPLVASQALFALRPGEARPCWVHRGGLLLDCAMASAGGRVFFLESRAQRDLARIPVADFLAAGCDLVALDLPSGAELWRQPLALRDLRHCLYLSATATTVLICGSTNHPEETADSAAPAGEQRTWYRLAAFDAAGGTPLWQADHANNRPGIGGGHGEQVHHPVLCGSFVIAEPLAYDLRTGARVQPGGGDDPWSIPSRRGCGTLSASADRLFLRDETCALRDLRAGSARVPLTRASRPGCWISILPACGLVLLPEASSGCVCPFPIQTSMAFAPLRR